MTYIKIPFDFLASDYKLSTAIVYGVIYTDIMNSDTKMCALDNTTIGKTVNLSRQTVGKAIKELVEDEEIIVLNNPPDFPIIYREYQIPYDSYLLGNEAWNSKKTVLLVPISLFHHKDLTPIDVLIYCLIHQCAKINNNEEKELIITAPKIASIFNINPQTVYRTIKTLCKLGFINVIYPDNIKVGFVIRLTKY